MGGSVAVPNNIENNAEKTKELGVEDVEKFINVVGVSQRYVTLDDHTSSDLCYEAAEALLQQKNIDRTTIDALLFVTQTSDYIQPATACVLHGRLGLKKETIAFDINLGCSGFVYGLSVASSPVCGMGVKRVLPLGGVILRKNKEIDVNIRFCSVTPARQRSWKRGKAKSKVNFIPTVQGI